MYRTLIEEFFKEIEHQGYRVTAGLDRSIELSRYMPAGWQPPAEDFDQSVARALALIPHSGASWHQCDGSEESPLYQVFATQVDTCFINEIRMTQRRMGS